MLRIDIELQRGTFHRQVRIEDDSRVVALVAPPAPARPPYSTPSQAW